MRRRTLVTTGRMLVLLTIAAGPVLLGSTPAGAAVCVRLSTSPVHPVLGRPIGVQLRTLAPLPKDQRGYRLEPRAVASTYPFHVAAESADQIVLIHVERSSDPQVWTGQFVLSEVGLWHLRVENFDRARSIDPRCYSELPLVVASGATERTSTRMLFWLPMGIRIIEPRSTGEAFIWLGASKCGSRRR